MSLTNLSFAQKENFNHETSVSLRVSLVVTACFLSTLGNFIVLIIFNVSVRKRQERSGGRCRVVDIILASLALTGLIRGLLVGLVQTTCLIRGEWVFDDVFCQMQAYVDAMLRYALPWYIGLLSIERYTKILAPHEYLVTFSPPTVNMILPSILLVVIVQVTAPVYGWGQYSYLPGTGLCALSMTSHFGCSYAIYILCSLIIPPLLIICVTWGPMIMHYYKPSIEASTKHNITSGNSRMLDIEREISSLFALVVIFIIFSAPRCTIDTAIMCNALETADEVTFFFTYFLDSATCIVFPVVYLSLHKKWRILLRSSIQTNMSIDN